MDGEWRFRGWLPNLREQEGERFPSRIPLCHVEVADRPDRVVVDPGGVLLCHEEELRRWEDPRSLDRVPDDRTVEISMENALGPSRKR